jgi:predicted nucleic acid-binding protein
VFKWPARKPTGADGSPRCGRSRATYVALPVDEAVASAFAVLVAAARRAGLRPKVQDAWIAATAQAHSAAVYTQDRHFDGLPHIEVVLISERYRVLSSISCCISSTARLTLS